MIDLKRFFGTAWPYVLTGLALLTVLLIALLAWWIL